MSVSNFIPLGFAGGKDPKAISQQLKALENDAKSAKRSLGEAIRSGKDFTEQQRKLDGIIRQQESLRGGGSSSRGRGITMRDVKKFQRGVREKVGGAYELGSAGIDVFNGDYSAASQLLKSRGARRLLTKGASAIGRMLGGQNASAGFGAAIGTAGTIGALIAGGINLYAGALQTQGTNVRAYAQVQGEIQEKVGALASRKIQERILQASLTERRAGNKDSWISKYLGTVTKGEHALKAFFGVESKDNPGSIVTEQQRKVGVQIAEQVSKSPKYARQILEQAPAEAWAAGGRKMMDTPTKDFDDFISDRVMNRVLEDPAAYERFRKAMTDDENRKLLEKEREKKLTPSMKYREHEAQRMADAQMVLHNRPNVGEIG